VSGAVGATIAKRRLSRQLRELREATGLTADGVCARLGWGRGKVGRIESNTWKRPEMSDVRDLLRFYHVGDKQYTELERLARLARARPWWRDYPDVFGDSEFPGLESDAARICCYTPLVLPGLLQTPAYTRAQMSVGTNGPGWPQRAAQARQRRQQILRDHHPGTGTGSGDGVGAPQLVAVITEPALLYRWGTPTQRHAQLDHLIEMGRRPDIEIRLLRLADGLHPGMCGPINIVEFPDGDPPAVFLETDFAVQEVTSHGDINAYIDTFHSIRKAALDPPATIAGDSA
jgi:transcriptional regulator with XRE-family HTH domain